MRCIGESIYMVLCSSQILTSMLSGVGEGSCTLNHGGELKVQQELVGPHPHPSHRGSPFGQRTGAIPPSYACLTEVVLPHKWGNVVSISAPSDTGAYCRGVICGKFIKTISKGPDVLAGGAVCDTNAIDIISVD